MVEVIFSDLLGSALRAAMVMEADQTALAGAIIGAPAHVIQDGAAALERSTRSLATAVSQLDQMIMDLGAANLMEAQAALEMLDRKDEAETVSILVSTLRRMADQSVDAKRKADWINRSLRNTINAINKVEREKKIIALA